MEDAEVRFGTGMAVANSMARWIAAAILILYGFAKLNGSQFTVLDSEVTKPLGEVSGFWLTWYYFGYSKVYGTLIALVQILGGLLLIWPRTSLLGALLLFPVVVNIVLTDIFFGVNALAVALLVLVCLGLIVLPHVTRLRKAVFPGSPGGFYVGAMRLAAALALMGFAWSFTYWTANYNNRAPSPIDGIWRVDESPAGSLSRVFFEYNRAHLVVFRSPNGTDQYHHFEVEADGHIRVWESWLSRGALLYEGQIAGTNSIQLRSAKDSTEILLRRESRVEAEGPGNSDKER